MIYSCVRLGGVRLLLPLGHGAVSVHWSPQTDVDASDCVDITEDQQHGSGHGLKYLHDVPESVDGHVTHVGGLLSAQDVGQTQLAHVDGSLQ